MERRPAGEMVPSLVLLGSVLVPCAGHWPPTSVVGVWLKGCPLLSALRLPALGCEPGHRAHPPTGCLFFRRLFELHQRYQ